MLPSPFPMTITITHGHLLCPSVAWVSLLAGFGGLECVTGTSLAESVGSSSAFGMGVDMV